MNYSSVSSPKWANQEQTVIECIVNFDAFGPTPFGAVAAGDTDYSAQIFADCVAGKYGEIAAYQPPPPPPPPTAAQNKSEAERRLAATDWVNQPDVYDPAINPHLMNRDDFLAYRAVVRGIAVNPSAGVLDWPVEPTAAWSQA
jgi:hypothetical protein